MTVLLNTHPDVFFLDEKKGKEYRSKAEIDKYGKGEFVGYASVFGNVDSYGDIVHKGAFVKTLAEHKQANATIPILFGHDMNNPMQNVGEIISAKEDEHGLQIHGKLDIDTPEGNKVYRLLKSRRIRELSIGYIARNARRNSHGGSDLLDVELLEVSIVPVAANRQAIVTEVKSDPETESETIIMETETQETVAPVTEEMQEQGKTCEDCPAKQELETITETMQEREEEAPATPEPTEDEGVTTEEQAQPETEEVKTAPAAPDTPAVSNRANTLARLSLLEMQYSN